MHYSTNTHRSATGPPDGKLAIKILAELATENPSTYQDIQKKLIDLPVDVRGPFIAAMLRQGVVDDEQVETVQSLLAIYGFLSADEIRKCELPPLSWIVSGLLPVGLSFLAGPPKGGKSILAMQLSKAVASGTPFLGHPTTQGLVINMALEDSIRRLKDRMEKQGWGEGLPVHFLTVQGNNNVIETLLAEDCLELRNLIAEQKPGLVIIDTFSRAVNGDQMDVGEMTHNLTPLHKLALEAGCCILIIDHHRKGMPGRVSSDPVADILGSTAKGGVADTIWGFYPVRSEQSARLVTTGRDADSQTIDLAFDAQSFEWVVRENDPEQLNANLQKIVDLLKSAGPLIQKDIAEQLGVPKGTISKRIHQLEDLLVVELVDGEWRLRGETESEGDAE